MSLFISVFLLDAHTPFLCAIKDKNDLNCSCLNYYLIIFNRNRRFFILIHLEVGGIKKCLNKNFDTCLKNNALGNANR